MNNSKRPLLTASNIGKIFGRKSVLDRINFSIQDGEVIGIIGPNGSGKTTLLNILMGMIKPSTGECIISTNVKIAMAVSRKGFFDDMTVINNILLYARLLHAKEPSVENLMDEFLIDFKHMRYGKLSAGMKQRVSLLTAFINHNANLILLDEPSNHLDIDSILILRTIISKQKEAGTSFLLASHIFSDIENLCDRIIFIKNGIINQFLETNELLQQYGSLEEAYLDNLLLFRYTLDFAEERF